MAYSFPSSVLCESTHNSNGLGAASVSPDWEVTHLAFDGKGNITEHLLTTRNRKEERRIILIICLLPYLWSWATYIASTMLQIGQSRLEK